MPNNDHFSQREYNLNSTFLYLVPPPVSAATLVCACCLFSMASTEEQAINKEIAAQHRAIRAALPGSPKALSLVSEAFVLNMLYFLDSLDGGFRNESS